MTTPSNLRPALDAFLDVAPSMGTAWEHLTCSEADVFARLALAAGSPDVAAMIVALHADEDETEDLHGAVRYSDLGDDDTDPTARKNWADIMAAAVEYAETALTLPTPESAAQRAAQAALQVAATEHGVRLGGNSAPTDFPSWLIEREGDGVLGAVGFDRGDFVAETDDDTTTHTTAAAAVAAVVAAVAAA